MIHHILSHSIDWQFSRLSLAVLAGTLESMVEATPLRLGHTHLCQLHTIIHPEGHSPGAAIYYTRALLPLLVRADLQWWLTFLAQGRRCTARSTRSAVMIPRFGDGSGTGTGGTLGLPNQPLRMSMAQWSLTVFSFSSNWKELKTLQLTLQQLLETNEAAARGSTIFYFTDNSTTYWITASGSSSSPGLHALIEDIRALELCLQCHLQVVHIPGTLMIGQGTDGLSHGV
jgi:hypothetical protein